MLDVSECRVIVFLMHPICQMESFVCNPFYTIAPISFKLGTVTRHNGQMWMKVEIIDTLDISKCKVEKEYQRYGFMWARGYFIDCFAIREL